MACLYFSKIGEFVANIINKVFSTDEININKEKADAEVTKAEAQAQADAQLIEAQAQAEVNSKLSSSITDELIRMKEAEARNKFGWVTISGTNNTVVTDK